MAEQKKRQKPLEQVKLVHKLGFLVCFIVFASAAGGAAILYANEKVTRETATLEQSAAFQEDYSMLLNTVNQVGLLHFQLVTSGYNEDRIERADLLLGEAGEMFTELNREVSDHQEMRNYFSLFEEAINNYAGISDSINLCRR
ncbi:hypothetical protein JSY36_19065 [Bacillus sp. H-16]|uniref:hypothetical protein n=1 Tax=Alteribacter salitolerans TaxID=2912333 RepID=UPI001964F0D1|nr:hypothetical protein [Alteribacter salitolerans]MBM7097841.1 hypothetical protein [Alteribacter salitolerans]